MASGQIVTNEGFKLAVNRIFDGTPTYTVPNAIKFGIGTDTPVAGDTDLGTPIPVTGTESVDDCNATTGWADSADMTLSVNSTTFKEGGAALNLTKDAGTVVDANTEKTTTSLDFTDKDFHIWIYANTQASIDLLAVTGALTLRFGSDSSNYYEYVFDRADFAVVGWNLFTQLTIANADSTTGTPVDAAMDFTFVQLTTAAAASTWAVGEFIMDDIKLISADDYLEAFASGFPIIDEVNFEAEFRANLATTEANGYSITEAGSFNSDSSPLIFSRAVFTAITKTNTVSVIYTEVNKLTRT